MDFQKFEAFIRKHWPAAVFVLMVTVPSIWMVAHTHFSQKIESLESQISILQEQLEGLQVRADETEKVVNDLEKRENDRNKIVGGEVKFPTDSFPDMLVLPSDGNAGAIKIESPIAE